MHELARLARALVLAGAASAGGLAAHAADMEMPAAVKVLNPDLAGLQPLPGGGLLAWGSDASIWQHDAATATGFGTAVWRPAATPHSGRIRGLAVARYGQALRLVAVGDAGLLMYSDDGGARWRPALLRPALNAAVNPPAPAQVPAQQLAVAGTPAAGEPISESTDLAAVACAAALCLAVGPQQTLLRSLDGGAHWQADAAPAGPASPPSPSSAPGPGLAPSTETPAGAFTTVVMGPGGAAWVGTADGRLWQQPGPQAAWRERQGPQGRAPGWAVAIDAITPDGTGLLLATSDGQLWSVSEQPSPARRVFRHARGSSSRLAALPAAGAQVATGSDGACAFRPAAAHAWRSCGVLPRRLLRGLASSPDGRHWVVAGEGGLLMHGRPPQRAWQAVRLPVLQERPDLEAVVWSEARGGFVAVGPGGLVLHGSADGRRWTVANSAPRHYVHDVAATPGGGLLAAMSFRRLARSEDGGRHWRSHLFTVLHEPAFLFALHVDAQRGSVVVAGGQGGLLVAPDGQHWRHHSTGHGREHLDLLPLPGQPVVLLYGSGGHLMRVHSEAAQWHDVLLPSTQPMYGAFTDPDGHPWLLGGDGGTARAGVVQRGSVDGLQWQAQRLGSAVLRTGGVVAGGQALLVAGDRGALFRAAWPPAEAPTAVPGSTPGSEAAGAAGAADASSAPPAAPAWQPVALPGWSAPDTPLPDWGWLQTDAAGQALWLGGSGGALARSTDGGLSWQRVALPTEALIRRPSWDERRRAWWMPGRHGTLLRSDDDGRSWRAVFTNTREHLKGVWVDPHSGALVLYGARLVHLMPAEAP